MASIAEAWNEVAAHVLAGLAAKGAVHSETEISKRVTIALSYADAFAAQLEKRQADNATGMVESA